MAAWRPRSGRFDVLLVLAQAAPRGSTPEASNVDVLRVRRPLAQAGVKNATDIIERRRAAAELRLGTDAVVIRDVAASRA